MSGLLRRIKRSRPADAGEPHPEGRAAEAEDAATTPARAASEDTRADASEATTQIVRPAAGGEGETAEGAATAGAGETTAEDAATSGAGEATAESAATTGAGEATAESAATTGAGEATAGAGDTAAEGAAPAGASEATPAKSRPRKEPRWRPFRRRAREIPPATLAPTPVLKADPNVPAGIDPAAAPLRPPAGRRGRLRRRLRYLRRARELMLRDLGGLLYEIHRTGGGNVKAHANVVDAKVQRIAGLDAEAHALETALAAPRAEAVVFEPGVGGTCATCGELYGSDARFCANCGAPIGAVPETRPPETHEVVTAPARRAFWRRAARPAQPAGDDAADKPATEEPPDEARADETASAPRDEARPDETAGAPRDEARPDEAATAPRDEARRDETADVPRDEPRPDETAAASPSDEARPDEPAGAAAPEEGADETAAEQRDQPAAAPRDEPPADEAASSSGAGADEPPRNPHSSGRNGRPEDRNAPGKSSGDPLFSRERS